jgi:uroporphyrin-III C-methyltransferase/precorrin-2 dehydrogenase/sirohydrochlorin ferrochelatase
LLAPTHTAEAGSIVVVGTGPGDPELLTLRAVRALQSADVILFDNLVSPEILDFARREAKKMLVGTTGLSAASGRHDVSALMIALARAGRRVVRLKGGDAPAVTEIAACRAVGIAVEVVPDVTAAPMAVRSGEAAGVTQETDLARAQA